MTIPRKNPFEEYDIDPRDGPRAITERLRELAEEAAGESERKEIRAAWEELTLHPLRRIRAAWGAHPSYPERAGEPPLPPGPAPAQARLALRDLAVLPSVAQALGPAGPAPRAPVLSLDEDPLFKGIAKS